MINSIKRAYGAGWRAGMAKTTLVRPGNTRGIKHIRTPLNPYSGPFCRRYRPLLAMAWECGQHDGLREKLSNRKAVTA